MLVVLALGGCTAILDLDRDFQQVPSTGGGSDGGGGGTDGATPATDGAAGEENTAPPPSDANPGNDSGGSPRDAAPDTGGAVNSIACGAGLSCSAGTPICCYVSGGTSTCSAGNCAAGLSIPCAVAADCAGSGKYCCVELTGTAVNQVSCQDTGSCVAANQAVLCDPTAATPCPAGKTCQTTNLTNVPGTYSSCQ